MSFFSFLLGVLFGIVAGWHIPQPDWVKELCSKVREDGVELIEKIRDKVKK